MCLSIVRLNAAGKVSRQPLCAKRLWRFDRKLPLENLPKFEGAGVYYVATHLESQMCGGQDVVVVGGLIW